MNKTSVLISVMFSEVLVVSVCFVFSVFTDYQFVVNNYLILFIILSVVFIGSAGVIIHSKRSDVGAGSMIFTASLLPLIEINYFFCMFDSLDLTMCVVVFSVWAAAAIWVTSSIYKKTARIFVFAVKAISAVISFLMLFPLAWFSFFTVSFGDIAENTVTEELTSPEGTYTVQIIDSNQGALGGDTLVYVYTNKGRIDFGFLEFGRDPEEIYRGKWGECGDMNAYWISDNELVIHDEIYALK